ncbi:MAG: glycosyltransferase family 2 protein [Synergistaceae bacterium]|nr:glycosyltransferase family 2 protein [Synergistaceae bacterium]
MDSPLQSVIIPTYNRKEMLAEALDSVLKQSQKSLEVIIVDDCSTDGTDEFVKTITDTRVRYFRNEKNSGPEINRSLGLRNARGKYITFLDDDDYYTDYDFFAKAVKIFEEHDSENAPLSFVCANVEMFTIETGRTNTEHNIGAPGRVNGLDYILKRNKPLSTFPTVFKAEILRKAGLENMRIFDVEIYREAVIIADSYFMSDYVGVYRVHKESISLGYSIKSQNDELYYSRVTDKIKQLKLTVNKLYDHIGKKAADKWYIFELCTLTTYFAKARPYFKDILKTTSCQLKVSGFMPYVWLILILYNIRTIISKITPLRKIYRFIKYRGKVPEDN